MLQHASIVNIKKIKIKVKFILNSGFERKERKKNSF